MSPERPLSHVLGVLGLLAIAIVRWGLPTSAHALTNDESIYFRAFDLVRSGQSPYRLWRRTLGPAATRCLICTTATLSQPIVWNYTLALALPVVVRALAVAWTFRPDGEDRKVRLLRILVTGSATFILLGSDSWNVPDIALYLQGVLTLVPILSLLALTRVSLRAEAVGA